MLSWGIDGEEWEISAQGVYGCDGNGCNCVQLNSGYVRVNAGDTILGEISQYEAAPDGWTIWIQDNATGAYAGEDIYDIPNSWPKYNQANGGVIEAYGINCSYLPPSDYVQFYSPLLVQGGPYWSSYNDVTHSISWVPQNSPFNHSPSCSWFTNIDGSADTTLFWVNH